MMNKLEVAAGLEPDFADWWVPILGPDSGPLTPKMAQ